MGGDERHLGYNPDPWGAEAAGREDAARQPANHRSSPFITVHHRPILNLFHEVVMTQNDPLTEKSLACAYRVANELGTGFLEKVYENALAHELRKAEIRVAQQHPIKVQYDGILVGTYAADLLVEGCILLELKACKALDDAHTAQCLNYLKATGHATCLLLNFGKPRVEVRRLMRGPQVQPGEKK
jgi:GxxExxY protein